MESILTSVKKLLGITEEYEAFDPDLIMHINTVLAILTQLGVGPDVGFFIVDKTATWSDWISNTLICEPVKSFVFLKVRLFFDPPASTAAVESMNKLLDELEYRIKLTVDTTENGGVSV